MDPSVAREATTIEFLDQIDTTRLKRGLNRTLALCGLKLVRLPTGKTLYEGVYPEANYAPWNADPDFLSTYNTIRANTLVDIYRCWELWALAGQTAKFRGGILEVGVWRGGTGALIAKSAHRAGSKDPVYLCDTFEGIVKAGPDDTVYKGGEHADTAPHIVEDLVRYLGLDNVRILKGIFPDETGHLIAPGERFRLCHIDVDVYSSARDVMAWVWDRLVPGGLVVYDDYGFSICEGITRHVNEQVRETDRIVLHNLNGHGIVIKTS